jgi:dTDP-glucose 4,6-dehydratase
VEALLQVIKKGRCGDTYLISGKNEKTNLDLVHLICRLLDEKKPRRGGRAYSELITFVDDRPGHDLRYAIDPSKIEADLRWAPKWTFDSGIEATIDWYIKNTGWCEKVATGQHEQRLGLRKNTA